MNTSRSISLTSRFPARVATCATITLTLLLAGCGAEPAATAAPKAAVAPTAAPAAPVAETAAQITSRANRAFAEQRFVAPAGDNALELFLQVREMENGHAGAQEALVELFPLTVSAIKAQLAQNQLDEAARMLALLDRAMPGSMAVVDLRADLGKRQKAADAALAAKAAAEAAALARANAPKPAEPPKAAAPAKPDVAKADVAMTEPAKPAPATAVAKPQPASTAPSGATAPMQAVAIAATTGAAPAPSAAKAAAPDAPEFTSPVAVARFPAEYPAQAKQRRVEGYVELEFTVDVNGNVRDVAILGSQPAKMFDRAAQRALQRWKFKPAERGGKAESARTRTTITFKLG